MEQQKIYNIKKRVFPLFNIIYTLLKQIFETFLLISYSNSANISSFDKHDKVNYAVTNSKFIIKKEERKVVLDLTIDTDIAPVLDYFEIFMDRTMMSKFAAKYLGIWFELVINDTKLL